MRLMQCPMYCVCVRVCAGVYMPACHAYLYLSMCEPVCVYGVYVHICDGWMRMMYLYLPLCQCVHAQVYIYGCLTCMYTCVCVPSMYKCASSKLVYDCVCVPCMHAYFMPCILMCAHVCMHHMCLMCMCVPCMCYVCFCVRMCLRVYACMSCMSVFAKCNV
jgi:hypothetical protein